MPKSNMRYLLEDKDHPDSVAVMENLAEIDRNAQFIMDVYRLHAAADDPDPVFSTFKMKFDDRYNPMFNEFHNIILKYVHDHFAKEEPDDDK